MASPFQIVALNPPARRLKSKGSRMARRKRIAGAARKGGKKFLGVSMPIVETGAGAAVGILGTNYITGVVLSRLAKDKPAGHWATQWYTMVGMKVGAAVVAGMLIGRVMPRMKHAVLAGGLASAGLSLAKRFAPNTYNTHFGLAGNGLSNELNALSGVIDSADILGMPELGLNGLGSYADSADLYRMN